MHHFVVVASPSARGIGEQERRLLDDPAPSELSFTPQNHIHWTSLTGSVHLASWSADELVPSTMKTAEGGVVALGGQPIVTQPTDAAALLHPEVVTRHARALRELTERLDGHYAVVSIHADGSGTIVSDPFGFHPLYLGHTGSVSVVSNRPGLVAAVLERVTGRALAPDEEAVAWVLLNGQMFGDGTGYHGVERLPFGSCAELEPEKGVYIRQWYEPPWPRRDVASVPVGESIDRVEQRMIATIRAALAATPGAVSSELTAGRDTRLILELAFRAGVADQLCFCTYPTSSQDGDVAARIAAHLGLRHEARPWPATPVGPTLESFVEHVRNTAAQLGCWETSNAPETEGITLSGLAGESLKTNYPKKVGLTTVEAATEGFDTHRFGRYQYVRSSALEDLRSRGRQLFLAPLEGGAATGRPLRHLLPSTPPPSLDRRQARPVRAVRSRALLACRRACGHGGGMGRARQRGNSRGDSAPSALAHR